METASDYIRYGFFMRAASKDTYHRSLKLNGLQLLHSTGQWQFGYRYLTTDGHRKQDWQQEVFVPSFNSSRRGPRVDLTKGMFIDIADSWMAYNSSMTTGNSRLNERQHAADFFYNVSPDWSVGGRFSYIYNRYDVNSGFAHSALSGVTPILIGTQLTSNFYEAQAGLAYKKDLSPFSIQFQFLPGIGRINARHLNQRNNTTTRFNHADGFSLFTSIGAGFQFKSMTLHVSAFAHRLYGRASKAEYTTMLTYGLPVQQPGADLNLKEGGYEIGIGYAF